MATAVQYSSITSGPETHAAYLPALPVNFSGCTASDGTPSCFTVGGWVRAQSAPPGNIPIFQAGLPFQIWLDAEGNLNAGFHSQQSQVCSNLIITDANWHFIAVSYQPFQSQTTSGVMRLYVDGDLLDDIATEGSAARDPQPSQLGPGSQVIKVEFASWLVWSVAASDDVLDVPAWGSPVAGSEDAIGLVAAFDFANGGVEDRSGNGWTASVRSQSWNTPCLQFTADESATVIQPSSMQINPGGGGAFSVTGWIGAPWFGGANSSSIILTNQSGNTPFLQIGLGAPGTGQPEVNVLLGQGLSAYVFMPTTWTHIALTYDGYSVSLYLNGTLADTLHVTSPLPSNSSSTLSLGGQSPIYLQNISIWSVALSGSQVAEQMSNLDPTGETGCIAHFPLVTDLCETVNHQQVGLHTNATVGEVQTPITGGAVQMRRRELTTPSTLVPASGDVALLRYKDYAALARKHGIDAEAATASVGADPSYGRGIAWYETMLKGVNPKLAATLRARFRRNFAVGMKLSELEPTVGRFSIAPVDGIHTITYTTLDGQRPVRGLSGELLGSTSTAVIYFTIFVDVVGIVAAMFGIVTTAAKVTNAAGVFDSLLEECGTAAANAASQAETAIEKVAKGVFAYINEIFLAGSISTLVWKIIAGSWWDLAFTVLSIVGQIAAMIASGGALIAVKVAQMAIAVGKLVKDLLEITNDGEVPAPA